jgi:hypothetical protein
MATAKKLTATVSTKGQIILPKATILVTIALCMAALPAQSRSLHVVGTAGYLSEWELEGELKEAASGDTSELSGPVTWKHVGLCSVNGPQEKQGEITIRLSKSGSLSRLSATMSLDGGQCVYGGDFSGTSHGYMDCSDSKGVPLSISIK